MSEPDFDLDFLRPEPLKERPEGGGDIPPPGGLPPAEPARIFVHHVSGPPQERIEVPFIGEQIPERAHPGDAGFDLYAAEAIRIFPGQTRVVSCGFKTAIPEGYVGLACSRSGMAAKHSVYVLNAPGVIDAGYRGDWCAILHNAGRTAYDIEVGDRVMQGIILPFPVVEFVPVEELPESTRGAGGFGSTGR